MANRVNLIVDQGVTFSTDINIVDVNSNPIDLSTYTISSQVRKTYTSSNVYSFTCNGFSNGVVRLSMANTVTANITSGRYVYDIKVVDTSNNVSRILEGIVTINPQVTL